MSRTSAFLVLALLSFSLPVFAGQPELHRATHLGNPATRFAPPLKTPQDLRRTLLSESLREDVLLVARRSGYNGDIQDLLRAAESAPIKTLSIAPNTLLPAMSTRRKGKVDVLYNVLWAGKSPIDAYQFSFVSGEHRYRVVAPRACSNFWVEEIQPPPKPELSLDCQSPAESTAGKPVETCCTLTNIGELQEPQAILTLPFPAGAKACCASGAGLDLGDTSRMTWKFDNLAAGDKRSVCANFTTLPTGAVTFAASATAQRAAGVSASTVTSVQPAQANK